jgi:hypothetical protein
MLSLTLSMMYFSRLMQYQPKKQIAGYLIDKHIIDSGMGIGHNYCIAVAFTVTFTVSFADASFVSIFAILLIRYFAICLLSTP